MSPYPQVEGPQSKAWIETTSPPSSIIKATNQAPNPVEPSFPNPTARTKPKTSLRRPERVQLQLVFSGTDMQEVNQALEPAFASPRAHKPKNFPRMPKKVQLQLVFGGAVMQEVNHAPNPVEPSFPSPRAQTRPKPSLCRGGGKMRSPGLEKNAEKCGKNAENARKNAA